MRHYFLAPKATLEGAARENNQDGRHHFTFGYLTRVNDADIAAEKLLVVLETNNDGTVEAFALLPGVESVGDPWMGDKVKPEHEKHLAHFGITAQNTVVELVHKAAEHWKGFRLRAL